MTQHVLRLALSALLVALSVPAAAQQPQKIPRIGYLSTRPAETEQILLPAFLHGLRELGYTEGKKYSSRNERDNVLGSIVSLGSPNTDAPAMIMLPGTPTTPLRTCPSPHLLDHLVRLEQERRGHGEAERLGGLEVDDQVELCGLLHRQVGGLRAL